MYLYACLLALLIVRTSESAPAVEPEDTLTSTTVIQQRTTQEPSGVNQQVSCTAAAQTNGVLEIGCWGYKKCVDGITVTHYCQEDEVFDRETFLCVPYDSSNTDCGDVVVCKDLPSQSYPDKGSKCASYHVCFGGVFKGRFYCPASLVFNEELQVCDYSYNVAPPCGTKTESA